MKKILILSGLILASFFFKTIYAQLSKVENADLIFMYEEEKLAHDVYLKFSEQFTIPVFKKITKSETYHMSLVLNLIQKYELQDPTGKKVGVFENKELQNFYNELIEKGSKGIVQALTVGATIEDVDIFDLEKILAETKNEEIVKVYKQLICGSENHMRAFTGHLKLRETDYKPQYLSQSRYDSIVSDEHKKCFEIK